jgi:hypothetical protein
VITVQRVLTSENGSHIAAGRTADDLYPEAVEAANRAFELLRTGIGRQDGWPDGPAAWNSNTPAGRHGNAKGRLGRVHWRFGSDRVSNHLSLGGTEMDQKPGVSEVQPAARKDRWARFRGLTWWQLVLTFLPALLLFVGGLVGGLIGAIGLVVNLGLARRQFSTGLKVGAMIAVVLACYLVYIVVAAVLYLLHVTH